MKKSAKVREAAAKVISARRLASKTPLKQTRKNAPPAAGKEAAAKKSLKVSPISGTPPAGSEALTEVKASSQL